MTSEQAKKIHVGDEVFWNDPDEGACSRILKVLSIEVTDNVAAIQDVDGSIVECFVEELE